MKSRINLAHLQLQPFEAFHGPGKLWQPFHDPWNMAGFLGAWHDFESTA